MEGALPHLAPVLYPEVLEVAGSVAAEVAQLQLVQHGISVDSYRGSVRLAFRKLSGKEALKPLSGSLR
jgi:hypothetical protein